MSHDISGVGLRQMMKLLAFPRAQINPSDGSWPKMEPKCSIVMCFFKKKTHKLIFKKSEGKWEVAACDHSCDLTCDRLT